MHRREERPRATLGGHLGGGSRLYLWKSMGFHGNHTGFGLASGKGKGKGKGKIQTSVLPYCS
jgi:hypothetical protein